MIRARAAPAPLPRPMYQRINYFAIGVFVVASLVAIGVLFVWLVASGPREATSRYALLFDSSVTGLELGSSVRFLGVQVGQVDSIDLMRNADIRVKVDLAISRDAPIDGRTYASLSYQGLTGVGFIALAIDNDLDPAAVPATVDGVPVIPTRSSGLSAVLDEGPQLVGRANRILERAESFLNADNSAALASILQNVEELSATLGDEKMDLAGLPSRIDALVAELRAATVELRETSQRVRPTLIAAVEKLDRAADNLVTITDRGESWLAKNEQNMDAFVSQGLAETPALITDTRAALRQLEKLLTELRANPSEIIFQPQTKPVTIELE